MRVKQKKLKFSIFRAFIRFYSGVVYEVALVGFYKVGIVYLIQRIQ